MLGTTGNDTWERGSDLVLYVSRDLERFEKKCVLVTDGSLSPYQNIWAPELHFYRGKYYLIVSVYRADLGRGSLIFVSDALDGRFTMLTGNYITPKGWGCLDATLFVYANTPYLCFSNEWMTPISRDGDGSLFIAELKEDLTELIGNPKKSSAGKTAVSLSKSETKKQEDMLPKVLGCIKKTKKLYCCGLQLVRTDIRLFVVSARTAFSATTFMIRFYLTATAGTVCVLPIITAKKLLPYISRIRCRTSGYGCFLCGNSVKE